MNADLRSAGVVKTERRLLREHPSKIQERFREAMDATNDGLWDWDIESGEAYCSPAWYRMLGYEESEAHAKIESWLDLIHPDDRLRVARANNDCIENRVQKFEVEFRMRTKEGDWKWILSRAKATARDRSGHAVRMIGTHSDITERKMAEERLRQSEERYRQRLEHLVTANPAAIYRGTPLPDNSDWDLTFISDRVTAILGFEPRQIADTNIWKSRVHPDDLGPNHTALLRIMKEGAGSFDYRFLHRDGTYRWIREEAKVNYDAADKPLEVYGYLTDITESKKSEETVRKSEARYRRLFESSPIALFEEDFSEVKRFFDYLRGTGANDLRTYFADHPQDLLRCASMVRVLDVNETALKMYGAKSVEELRGELRRLFTQESQPQFAQEIVALSEGKTRFESEFVNQSLTGESKHISLILTVVPGCEDTLSRVVVSTIDLTEKMTIEANLRSAKERLEHVIESNPAVVYIAAPLPDLSDYYATYKSPNVVSITGFESEELIGEKGAAFWAGRVHSDDLARYRAAAIRFWRDGYGAYEYRFLHKDGTYRWIREEAKVFRDSMGNVRDIIGYWTDVTDRKRLEEDLLKSQRLAAIGETASMVAHDLRNPLQGMTGAAYLLKQKSLTAKERDELLQLIEKSVAYSESIVHDLSDYSAEIQLNPTNTTPKFIIDEALHTVKIPANVTLQDLTKDQPTFKGDVKRLRRVFVNLIDNAIDAMPKGGKLTISSTTSEGAVEIVISDSGAGMPEKVAANLWKPFQTTKAKGLGLGLSISKRIIDAHGGTIAVESKVGVGTGITTTLPVNIQTRR